MLFRHYSLSYEDDLPSLSPKTILRAAHNLRHVVSFVKRRHDHSELCNAGVGASWHWQGLSYLVLHLIVPPQRGSGWLLAEVSCSGGFMPPPPIHGDVKSPPQ